jgi:RNA polymerase sigma-70 factor (ECF subfamily)
MTVTPTTRASLLLRLGDAQDHEAWFEFVTLYEPVIYRLIRQRGLQDADARDVMQDLLLAVSRNIERWQPLKERASFRSWLQRVTRNLVVNSLKSRQRRDVTGGSDLHALLDQVPAPDSAETVEFDRELRRAKFQQASQRVQTEVQPTTWQAFWETSVSGLSLAEAAKKLGMSIGAVRVAKCRVVARMKAVIAELEKQT